MRLFDFLEAFNSNAPILILDENRKIIDENIVGGITQKIMNQREILSAYPEKDKLVVITCLIGKSDRKRYGGAFQTIV